MLLWPLEHESWRAGPVLYQLQRENGPCTLPQQQSRPGSGGVGASEPAEGMRPGEMALALAA